MFRMTNNTISMVKGDTAQFLVDLTPYEYSDGDKLVFSIGGKVSKEVEANEPVELLPEDTANLTSGVYWYSAKLNTINGEVYTVLGPALFIMEG